MQAGWHTTTYFHPNRRELPSWYVSYHLLWAPPCTCSSVTHSSYRMLTSLWFKDHQVTFQCSVSGCGKLGYRNSTKFFSTKIWFSSNSRTFSPVKETRYTVLCLKATIAASDLQYAHFLSQGPLMNWLKVNFSQAFSAWIHLKAVRVFTESVLRYASECCVSVPRYKNYRISVIRCHGNWLLHHLLLFNGKTKSAWTGNRTLWKKASSAFRMGAWSTYVYM